MHIVFKVQYKTYIIIRHQVNSDAMCSLYKNTQKAKKAPMSVGQNKAVRRMNAVLCNCMHGFFFYHGLYSMTQ